MDDVIKLITQAGLDPAKAAELLKSLQPVMTKTIISQRPCNICIDYIKDITKRDTITKKGESLVIESFQLSDRRITVFHRNNEYVDNTALIGTRACFLLTKQDSFNGRINYTGILLSPEQVSELLSSYFHSKNSNGSKPTPVEIKTSNSPKPIPVVSKG